MELEYLDLEQIHAAELEMLKAFDGFCMAHELRYSLFYGTLIGAVRHKGFIPWDDDVDVAMPRPDYERLLSEGEALGRETGFFLSPMRSFLVLEESPLIKVCNPAIAVEERGALRPGSLWIDVFPVDGLPENEAEAKALAKRLNKKRLLFVALTSPASSALTFKRKVAKLLLKPVGLFKKPESISREMTQLAEGNPFDGAAVVNALTWTSFGFEGRFAASAFDSMEELEFEGCRFTAISEWDRNLKGVYGDYMTLPPVEKRETHSLKAWRRGEF